MYIGGISQGIYPSPGGRERGRGDYCKSSPSPNLSLLRERE